MKKGILLTCIVLLLALTQGEAKMWRVNNRTGIVADFTTLQAAHDGALAGDTVMLEPSPTSYGSLTCTKKLVILGGGYFLTENYPNYFTGNNSTVGLITFESGSQNSVVMGLSGVSISPKTSNLLIARNYDVSVSNGNSANSFSNILIVSNYMLNLNIGITTNSNNIIVRNNHMTFSGSLIYSSSLQILFLNNIIYYAGSAITFNGQTLSNNIVVAGANFTFNTGTLFSNNIDAYNGTRAIFGTTNGNKGATTVAAVFVGATGNSTDGQWKLKAGSPAIAAAADGGDCGMYGGQDPYVLSGAPPIPLFTKLLNSSVGSNTSPVKITISVESKN